MVDAWQPSVAFSADPVGGERGICVISAVRGLGEKLVSGEVNASDYRVDQRGDVDGAEGGPLSAEQAQAVAGLARAAEAALGAPQDIEWAFDQGGKLHLLQSRPITTLDHGELRIWDNSNIAKATAASRCR
ncbi:MAG: PEP/pyruvate-binding domain-containing protein [Verrucomicrobiales bacterium]